jgi:hypothetical protein
MKPVSNRQRRRAVIDLMGGRKSVAALTSQAKLD